MLIKSDRGEMKISEKRRKWLTKRAFFNCMVISSGVLVISIVFDLTLKAFHTELPFPYRLLYIWFALLLLTVMLWILGFLFPELIEVVFKMLGFEEKEDKT